MVDGAEEELVPWFPDREFGELEELVRFIRVRNPSMMRSRSKELLKQSDILVVLANRLAV